MNFRNMNMSFRCIRSILNTKGSRTYCSYKDGSGIITGNNLSTPVLEKHRKHRLAADREKDEHPDKATPTPKSYYNIFPEFLPVPDWKKRDRISEKLERKDMLRRRNVIDIPEFYVGSIVAATVSDQFAPGKQNRFVGIVILKEGQGMRAQFILRNIVDNLGVEIMYEMYSPLLLSVEVIKLEKRLDDQLLYLRDTTPEHSYVPFNMDKVLHPPGAAVPVNTTKVKLGPYPWFQRWELFDLKGVEEVNSLVPPGVWKKSLKAFTPWEKYDLMKQYRNKINDDEAEDIMSKVHNKLSDISEEHKRKMLTVKETGT